MAQCHVAVDLIGQYRDAGVQLLINSDYRNDLETHELMGQGHAKFRLTKER